MHTDCIVKDFLQPLENVLLQIRNKINVCQQLGAWWLSGRFSTSAC